MANVIPMAGLGSRFSKNGYKIPKPLILVDGVPMIHKVIDHLPASDKWIFLVRQEHIEHYQVDQVIKKKVPDAIIVAVNKTTLGQANTCLLAQAYLLPEEPIFIAACDNICQYDQEQYSKLLDNPEIDAIVWTFTQMEKMRTSPQSYGWAVVGKNNHITDMSVKVPISKDPYYDHAVVATFHFKKSKDFFNSISLMITENHKINNEFYVDAVPIFLNKLRKKSVIFDVDKWICWGTPMELREYERGKELELGK
jgi:NDP-sugar pyrophosphorylase family protein